MDKVILYIILWVVLGFLVVPAMVFHLILKKKKYDLLNEYLRYTRPKQEEIPLISGRKYVNLSILTFVLFTLGSVVVFLLYLPGFYDSILFITLIILISLLFFIGGTTLSTLLIIHEYRWQQAYNELVLSIDPNCKEVFL